MLRNVYLYGDLAEKYGNKHKLNVASIGEALRALEANYNGFLNNIKRDGYYDLVRGETLNDEPIGERQLKMQYGKGDFHISPTVEGSGDDGGIIMAVIGVVLIVAGVLLIATPFGAPLIMAGIGLLAGGISMMLSPTPNYDDYGEQEAPAERNSFYFDGPTNTMEQGGVLPIVYGRMIVGSTVISAGIEVEAV